MEQNYISHKLQMSLSTTVSKNILARIQNYYTGNLKRMLLKWKQTIDSENKLLNLNKQMKSQITSMKQQLEGNSAQLQAKKDQLRQRMASHQKDAKDLAADYAEKVKKQRSATDNKEGMKQRLMDQYNQQKRQNKQLKEKLDQTEMTVQQFISEMGFLIDQGVQQPPPASTRVQPGASLNGGRNIPQPNRTHYVGGGSGESTGGSASIF